MIEKINLYFIKFFYSFSSVFFFQMLLVKLGNMVWIIIYLYYKP